MISPVQARRVDLQRRREPNARNCTPRASDCPGSWRCPDAILVAPADLAQQHQAMSPDYLPAGNMIDRNGNLQLPY
jgi:hypothetical protein